MSIRQISVASTVLLMIYVIQESVVSQLRLPGGGFSILLIFALTWAVLSETEVAAVIGFAAGFLMDLSQTAAGPFGQWTLIMLLAGYAISYIGFGVSQPLYTIPEKSSSEEIANRRVEVKIISN